MGPERKPREKKVSTSFQEMFEAFGKAMSEILNDPELKKKARELGQSAAQSADALADRFRDEDVKRRWRELGKAAQQFGENVADYVGETVREKKTPGPPKKE